MRAVARKLVKLAQLGNIDAMKLFLAAFIGPVTPIDPDEIDRHELGVRQRQPTELDELMLIAQGNGSDGGRPELSAAEDAEDDGDMPELEPTPEEPLLLIAWEQFAQERLEWDPQAAASIDMVFLAYVRWSEKRDLPLLAEADMCTWLREHGASVTASTYSKDTVARGVRVTE